MEAVKVRDWLGELEAAGRADDIDKFRGIVGEMVVKAEPALEGEACRIAGWFFEDGEIWTEELYSKGRAKAEEEAKKISPTLQLGVAGEVDCTQAEARPKEPEVEPTPTQPEPKSGEAVEKLVRREKQQWFTEPEAELVVEPDEAEPEGEGAEAGAEEARPEVRVLGVLFGAEPDRSGDTGPALLSQSAPFDNAREWARRRGFRGGQLATFFHGGKFWQWNGQCYEGLSENQLRTAVWDFLSEAKRGKVEGGEYRMVGFMPKPEHVNGLIDGLRAGLGLELSPGHWLDTGEPIGDVIAFSNGLVDVASGELRPITPRLWVQGGLAFAYDPEAKCPRWEQFLEEVFPGDEEAQDCVEEQLGYGMTDDYSIHKGAMWIGKRRSGKGTAAWVQRQLVGEAYYAGLSFNTWVRGENSGQPLIGKKVLCFPDVRLKPSKWYGQSRDRGGLDHVSVELLLNITGGDPVTLGRKWIEAWGGQLRGKVILISNDPPDLGDGTLPTRFVKVRFEQCFEDRLDLGLQGKLRPELPGIAVRCLAAYRRLKAREGFIQPKSASWLEEDVAANSNPYAQFVAMHVVREDGAEEYCSVVRGRFETWCEESGQLDVLKSTPKNLLTTKLREQGGLAALRSYRPHGGPRKYLGIHLRKKTEMYDFREGPEGEEGGERR